MRMSGADITIKLLENQGIKVIAGIPGGGNLPLYDALYKSNIKHVLARHEQGAAFIAQGIARTTGKAAVCFATSGPGATNLLTAIADAKLDSVPMVAITGQVPFLLVGTDAFQEVDTYGLTVPITKHNFFVRSIEELFTVIPEAFRYAECGRPGPVVIDIPKNLQSEMYEFEGFPKLEDIDEYVEPVNIHFLKEAAEYINSSKKPVLYIGGGIPIAQGEELIRKLSEKSNIPVATTLMGLGSFPLDNPLYLGMLGMHGARYTNILLEEADLLLAFGVRFDDRATGNVGKFCPRAKIIHIDIDEAEIGKIKKVDLSIQGDINKVLEDLIPLIEENSRKAWVEEIRTKKMELPFVLPDKKDYYHPLNIIKMVSEMSGNAIVTTDVGQHQMWTAQVYPVKEPRTFLTSGGLGTMGFGLPAAIGAAIAMPDRMVICFAGDGSLLMNIQELATLADLGLNVKIIVMNNGHLGLVRQQQQMFYHEHYMACKFQTDPDFAMIAEGFKIKGYTLSRDINPEETLKKILLEKGPALINVPINQFENVFPIVPPGAGNTEMVGGE